MHDHQQHKLIWDFPCFETILDIFCSRFHNVYNYGLQALMEKVIKQLKYFPEESCLQKSREYQQNMMLIWTTLWAVGWFNQQQYIIFQK